jgi:hypothetical protein
VGNFEFECNEWGIGGATPREWSISDASPMFIQYPFAITTNLTPPPRVLRSHVQIVQSTLQRVAAVETEYDFLEFFLPETLFHTFPIVTPELFCKPEHDRNRAESVRQNALKPLRHKDPPSRNKTSDNQQFSERTGTITHTNRMPDTTIWAFGGLIDQSFSSAARGTQSKSMKILWAGYLRRN